MQHLNVENSNGSYPALRVFTNIYIVTLLATETIIFGLSLATHIMQLFGNDLRNHQFAETITKAVLLLGLSIVPFVKDAKQWRSQLSLCPRWMSISALIFAAYGFTSLFWTPSLLEGGNGDTNSDQAHFMFVLGFETIPICILYSVLFKSVFSAKEKNRRVFYSICMLVPFFAALAWKLGHSISGHQ
jgi:hypothetical protein